MQAAMPACRWPMRSAEGAVAAGVARGGAGGRGPRRAFGLLAGREVAEGIRGGAARSEETVVVTLSGVVEVANGLEATGRAERVGAYGTARISGQGEPIRLQIQRDDMKPLLQGLTPVRAARSHGNRAE